jgi:hypothetical protein
VRWPRSGGILPRPYAAVAQLNLCTLTASKRGAASTKSRLTSRCILKHANLPTLFWSETTTMYMSVRNIMPTDKMSVSFTEAQPHRLHFDPKLLLHRPGCLIIVKYPKDHPRVTDTSNGARGVRDIFLGCHATSPLVKVWIPSPREIAYQKEVKIFDDKMPFADLLCMPNRQGFSDKDIEALRKLNNRQASRTSPRTPAESALPASVHAANDATPAPVSDMQASAARDGDADLIQQASARWTPSCMMGACT